jgi:hypothetical protein
MMRIIGRGRLRQLITAGLTLAMLAGAAVCHAGVIDSLKPVDNLTIFLGAVTAAIVKAHSQTLPELLMHGRAFVRRFHAVYLVAMFSTKGRARVSPKPTLSPIVTKRVGNDGPFWATLSPTFTFAELVSSET